MKRHYTESTAFQQAMFADTRQAFTPHELLKYAFAQPNRFPPGDGFEYSNTNTVLLGLVVGRSADSRCTPTSGITSSPRWA